jgi:hypothetical protein
MCAVQNNQRNSANRARCEFDPAAVVGGRRVEVVIIAIDEATMSAGSSSGSGSASATDQGADLLESDLVLLQMKKPTGASHVTRALQQATCELQHASFDV